MTLTSRTILKKNDETEHPFLGTYFNKIVYSILLMKVKEESEKVSLKLNSQKTEVMASSATSLPGK